MLEYYQGFRGSRLGRICTDVKAECKFIEARHRFEIHDHKILRALTPWFDREFRVASRVEAAVAAHHFFESLPVLGENARCKIDRVETGVAVLQVERLNIAMKSETGNRTLASKKRPQPL